MKLTGVGIWSWQLRSGEPRDVADAAAELEVLGYSALWIPGGAGGPVFEAVSTLLEATRRVVVTTGILNVWMHDPADVAAAHARITQAYPQRFLLGLGISHAPLVDARSSRRYERP